ncbi:MAG: sigma-70 family RNA polymerase sigma factor [Oscillospiraceae bacterium]|nr:sigma-70 family RNA polymerase sigma factor [Oscillospiraceae bacterium]MBQ9696157.1 sigma-70 family RNA polymerase sigma factor [Oscillospiraceae bacterium]MBR1459695.1 sigma-70 family RNA polymerase sigma factor [Oscillospiraceae bacterium]MBR1898605.1 sigma-70 family RNA polymerase sigma factor [Oscillospiraceae bacterium]
MTDKELCALIREDPARGHAALYDTYANYMYAIIFRILRDRGSREDAEDCLVETLLEIIRHIGCIEPDSLRAYIGQASRNRALNYSAALGRRARGAVPLEDAPEPSETHVEEDVEQKALQSRLLREIEALGEPDSTILIQKYYYDRKMPEIARMVGLTANAAQVRCHRALKRLRETLKDWR